VRKRAIAIALVCACLGPTEIFVDISADFPCSDIQQTDIYVLQPDAEPFAPNTTEYGCVAPATGEIGSIVLVPAHGIDDRMLLDVRTTLVDGTCAPPSSSSCIEAKRAIGYIPHTRLELPIVMHALCAGHACGDGQTCEIVNDVAACVNDAVGCDADGGPCGLATDAGSTSTCQSPMSLEAGAPTYVWSFDQKTLAEDEDSFPAEPISNGDSFADGGVPGCGSYFVAAASQQLAVLPTLSHFRMATWTRGTSNATLLTFSGIALDVVPSSTGNGYTIQIQDITGSGGSYTPSDPTRAVLADGAWHRVEAEIDANDSTTLHYDVWVDGVDVMPSATMQTTLGTSRTFLVGSANASPTDFDEVSFYAYPPGQ